MSLAQTFCQFDGSFKKQKLDMVLTIRGTGLTIPALLATTESKAAVCIMADAKEKMQKNSDYLQQRLDRGHIIYGVNTGFGGSSTTRCQNLSEQQRELLRFLTCGIGKSLDPSIIRAVMIVRANSMSRGYSGVRPEVPGRLLEMVNKGVTPMVPMRGTISASGDLIPTAYIAAAMAGYPNVKALYEGKILPAAEALERAGIQPIVYNAKEALALINAASFGACLAAQVLFDGSAAVLLTQVATALSMEAMKGHTESFHPTVYKCLSHEGNKEVSKNILHFLRTSSNVLHGLEVDQPDDPTRQKQDRYALRTSPQWLGPVVETIQESIKKITIELNSASDNPLVDDENGSIIHSGNFQGTATLVAMDQTRQALQLCGRLLFAQFCEIVNADLNNGLSPNACGGNPCEDFGFKGVDIAMASLMSELEFLANNMTNHVISAELNNQSINSLAFLSARYTKEALDVLQMMLSYIFCIQTQACDLRHKQGMVYKNIISICDEYGLSLKIRNEMMQRWFDFLHSPQKTLNFYLRHEKPQKIEYIKMFKNISQERDIFEVSEGLGKGTHLMYLFIRRDLKVPFFKSTIPIDTNIKKIHDAITSRSVNHVLVECLQGTEDNEGYSVASFFNQMGATIPPQILNSKL